MEPWGGGKGVEPEGNPSFHHGKGTAHSLGQLTLVGIWVVGVPKPAGVIGAEDLGYPGGAGETEGTTLEGVRGTLGHAVSGHVDGVVELPAVDALGVEWSMAASYAAVIASAAGGPPRHIGTAVGGPGGEERVRGLWGDEPHTAGAVGAVSAGEAAGVAWPTEDGPSGGKGEASGVIALVVTIWTGYSSDTLCWGEREGNKYGQGCGQGSFGVWSLDVVKGMIFRVWSWIS